MAVCSWHGGGDHYLSGHIQSSAFPGFGNIIPALFEYVCHCILGSPKVATSFVPVMLAVFGLPFASKNSMYLNLFFMGTAVVWAYYLFKKENQIWRQTVDEDFRV